jgi:hypothetical protein
LTNRLENIDFMKVLNLNSHLKRLITLFLAVG